MYIKQISTTTKVDGTCWESRDDYENDIVSLIDIEPQLTEVYSVHRDAGDYIAKVSISEDFSTVTIVKFMTTECYELMVDILEENGHHVIDGEINATFGNINFHAFIEETEESVSEANERLSS